MTAAPVGPGGGCGACMRGPGLVGGEWEDGGGRGGGGERAPIKPSRQLPFPRAWPAWGDLGEAGGGYAKGCWAGRRRAPCLECLLVLVLSEPGIEREVHDLCLPGQDEGGSNRFFPASLLCALTRGSLRKLSNP